MSEKETKILDQFEKLAEISQFVSRENTHLKRFAAASLIPAVSSIMHGLGYEVPEELLQFSLLSNGMQILIAGDYLLELYNYEKKLNTGGKQKTIGLMRW